MTEEKQNEKDFEAINIDVADISFVFAMTRNEAEEIIKHPKGKVMKQYTKYMQAVVKSAARKFVDTPVGAEAHDTVKVEDLE